MPPPAYQFRGQQNQDKRSRPSHEFTFRFPRPTTSERPLLTTKRETTPELLGAPKDGAQKAPLKFAPLDELTDSDEAEMDVSSDDDEDGSRPPRKKRAVEADTAKAPPAPKWSNPDPYTVLPPPDETQTKKTDVVKLIRKARLAAAAPPVTRTDAVTTNEDFISFDFDDDLDGPKEPEPPENAPKGPKNARDVASGKRKRTHDDEIKGYSKKTSPFAGKFRSDGGILDQWKAHPSENGTPWLELMEPTLHVGTRLHNEILAFYNWVKPQPYEDIIRRDLVARLQSAFQSRYYGAEVHAFGSFASGLYLPIADMDLVLLSTTFKRTGVKTFGEKKGQIYAFSAFLKNLDIAVPGSIETIANARVPILKFVDKLTGLRVDLSFDNDSGLLANQTFQRWKAEYPAMPVIVAIIKQFLLLRGLNEVPSGGLGGYSIICLVVSLLQHMPRGEGNYGPNLGSILMDFFDFYGNKFDYTSVGIRIEPPGFFNKRVYGVNAENRAHRLSIEDPNNRDNDVSGGTREIRLIFKCFSEAFYALRDRMVAAATSGSNRMCFLDTIIAGCYDEYIEQRDHLRSLFENDPRFEPYRRPPSPPPPPPPPPGDSDSESEYNPPDWVPAPPPPSAPLPPPPAPPKGQDKNPPLTKQQKKERKLQASRDRAARLKLLRPDVAARVPPSVSAKHAMHLGGYKTLSEMDRDLAAREKQLKKR
ncbi:hypothetical protein VTN77DRAFT_1745 [Rasamsonia byssochlamydoides]|uniref:uncharacterized protein n=1 Tax=Rasamsonia byssochlamydoides TaxID=89139 RepID=UPI0037420464